MPTHSAEAPRCPWSQETEQLRRYHDTEWGFPVADDRRLFEKLCLEGFQAGLSWRTILHKRENFRAAFSNFDIATVASFTEEDEERLLQDAGIIRHRGKITAAMSNAKIAVDIITTTGSLAELIWSYAPEPAETSPPGTVTTATFSDALARDLRSRGWRFFGPTTSFAFCESMGLVNNHLPECVIRPEVEAARAGFTLPVRHP